MDVARAAQEGKNGGGGGQPNRQVEGVMQAGYESRRDGVGEETGGKKVGAVGGGKVTEDVTRDQGTHWVVSKESGKKGGRGRKLGHLCGDGRGNAGGNQGVGHECRQIDGQRSDENGEEKGHADEHTGV